jgi:hypothetical protein
MVKEAVGPIFRKTDQDTEDATEEKRGWLKSMFNWIPGGPDDPSEQTGENEGKDHKRGYDPLLDGDILDG